MLNILTRPPKIFFKGAATYYLKFAIRKLLDKKRGPDAVLESLKRGLDLLGQPFVINASLEKGQIVHVISNIEALRFAISHKTQAGIARLVAGPNLVILPDEHDSLLASPLIDIVLTVSPWVTELYGKIIPSLIPKMRIWPAGVQMPKKTASGNEAMTNEALTCIVFRKKAPDALYEKVIASLDERKIRYKIFEYGKFGQREYFDALETSKNAFMIYLQESESQGIALQEAWIRDVPTLVWNKGSYTSTTGITVIGNVAAPFLTDEAGMLFRGLDDLEAALDSFVKKILAREYRPKEYCMRILTDKASAETYLRAIV